MEKRKLIIVLMIKPKNVTLTSLAVVFMEVRDGFQVIVL